MKMHLQSKFSFDCEHGEGFSHGMNSVVGSRACREAKCNFKMTRDTALLRQRILNDGERAQLRVLKFS